MLIAHPCISSCSWANTFRPERNGHHIADDIIKRILGLGLSVVWVFLEKIAHALLQQILNMYYVPYSYYVLNERLWCLEIMPSFSKALHVSCVSGDPDQNRQAVDMILQKILEDPQSGSCPNISYADVKGPVASSNPTGSPFANAPLGYNGNFNGQQGGAMGMNNIGTGMNNLNIGTGTPALEQLRATLRGSGYSEQAVEEISTAVFTLANYGFLGLGLGLGLGGLGLAAQNQGTGNNLSLANLAGILQGGMNNANGAGSLYGGNGANADNNNPSVFGPVGSTTTTMAGGDTGEGSGVYFSSAGGLGRDYNQGNSMFGGSNYDGGNGFNSSGNYQGTNQNSFGLGTNMGSLKSMDEEGDSTKKDLEVGEHIVGAILGPGGKGIVELQKFSGANIQISKKGVYAQGTRNRIVTVTGSPSAVQRASILIQQRISQEEAKRARQSQGQGQGLQQPR